MPKKGSPTEIIESARNPEVEHAYIRLPGKEMREAPAKKATATEFQYKEQYEGPNQTHLHTHTFSSVLPSSEDMKHLLSDSMYGTMVIAQQDKDTGKVGGYFFLRKTKKTPAFAPPPAEHNILKRIGYLISHPKIFFNGIKTMYDYGETIEKNKGDKNLLREKVSAQLDKICSEYHMQKRFIPTKGYHFDKKLWGFYKENPTEDELKLERAELYDSFRAESLLQKKESRGSSLTSKVTSLIIASGFIAGLFFLSAGITGNTISNLSNRTTSLLGAGLFIICLIAGFFWLNNKKN